MFVDWIEFYHDARKVEVCAISLLAAKLLVHRFASLINLFKEIELSGKRKSL
jgi:hypothetical protein